MHIDYLYYFLDVAKTSSISKSAANYYMSQQGLSRAIRTLEEEFNIILLERKSNTIKLTSAGEDFVIYAQNVTDAYELLKTKMSVYNKDKNKLQKSAITMRATPFVFNYIFPYLTQLAETNLIATEAGLYEIIAEICKGHERNTLYLISAPTCSDFRKILSDTLQPNDIRFTPLIKTPLLAAVAKTSPYASQKQLSTSDLKGLSFACQNDHVLLKHITQAINANNITFISNNLSLLNQRIINNNAVGFVSALNKHLLPDEIVAIPFENSYDIEIGLLRNMKSELSPENLKVAEYIVSYCQKFFPFFVVDFILEGNTSFRKLSAPQ